MEYYAKEVECPISFRKEKIYIYKLPIIDGRRWCVSNGCESEHGDIRCAHCREKYSYKEEIH